METVELTCVRKDKVRVDRKMLEAVLEHCQLALHQLAASRDDDDDDGGGGDNNDDVNGGVLDVPQDSIETSVSTISDIDNAEFYGLLQSKVESADFLKKIENAQASISQNMAEESSSWDIVSKNETWDIGDAASENDDFVLVSQEDIVESIAAFMAAYLLSLEQSKDLAPNKLQEALSKTFSTKKKKGKLRKAWDGTKVIYNVASWGATAIGVYQNPVLLNAASTAFWTSYGIISKLL